MQQSADMTLSRLSGSTEITRNSAVEIFRQLSNEPEPDWSKMLAHYNILLDQARGIWGDDSDNSVARPQISLFKLYSPRPKKIPENSIGIPQLLSTMLPPEMTIAAEERSREGQAENESIADPQALAAHNASMDAVGLVIESKLAELGFSGRANRPI